MDNTDPVFRGEPLLAVLDHVRARLAAGETEVGFTVLDPDRGRGHHAGETIAIGGVPHVHRPWRVWIELADRLGLRLRTPHSAGEGLVSIRFERLADPAPRGASGDPTERYGTTSDFARVDKGESPGFVLDLADALARCHLPARARVLDLGVNDGRELALLVALAPVLADATMVGVDHGASALAAARARFPDTDRIALVRADLNALPADLGRFELIVSIGVLQSPGVDDRALLRRLVQDHLAPDGAIVLGVPNCRYRDGELVHGARMKNFRQPELGLVVKDVAFYRKYLQQHDRQVFVTGDHDLFVTGVRAPRP